MSARTRNGSAARGPGAGPALVLALLLTGCTALGPDYVAPQPETAPDWQGTGAPQIRGDVPLDARWWQAAFGDPELDALVDTALGENLTLRSAGLRVLQSQQRLAIAIGNQFPQQQLANGSASRQRQNAVTFEDYSVGFNLTWELDLWGRFRRQVESAAAELDASVAGFDGVLVSLVSQVAQNYILIRTLQERLAVARVNLRLQEESLRIAQAKSEAGATTELDADQAQSLLENTRANVLGLEVSLQQARNALAVLLGKPPHALGSALSADGAVPAPRPSVALGMPQDLIRRRPDLRQSERRLAAQSAQIGVAETDLYPAFSIGGTIGTSALSTADLFESDSRTWSLFGLFSWNLFNYGRLQSNVRLQDAVFQQLLVDYLDAVLSAQADAENAIVAYLKAHEQLAAYQRAAAASQRAVTIATTQYTEGEINFNTLINTLVSNTQQQDLLASAKGSVATSLVQVYRALGGGWEVRAGADPVDLLPARMKDAMRERTDTWDGVLD